MTHQTTGGYTLHKIQDGHHSYCCSSENSANRALFFNSLEVLHFKNRKHTFTYLLIDFLTYSMEQSPSWEANWFSAGQEIPRILWNPKVHYRIHTRLPPVPILRRLVQSIGLFPSGFPTKTLYTPLLSPIHATYTAHLILLDWHGPGM